MGIIERERRRPPNRSFKVPKGCPIVKKIPMKTNPKIEKTALAIADHPAILASLLRSMTTSLATNSVA
jgi:hypothetical protein